MIELRDIVKDYPSGDEVVHALKGVGIRFRDSEFVSILGPSGCGKTTLLNILGGLDHYTSGDLVINGRSTKGYRESDWDTYRNHSVGFVFQSYNLIPHQTVLSNVELALTMSGVGRAERHRRALEALESVGLGDQAHKRPAQLSGGQMQRVAIARALVNDPDIVLADEPTGALDSQTSVQVLEILKKVSHDRLVIMVTHNPELAEHYSTRVVHLLDGRVTSDSNPFEAGEEPAAEKPAAASAAPGDATAGAARPRADQHKGRRRMGPVTAMGLSMRNLMTKRGRTVLTAFAGSIGIIGIALILSLSNGAQSYITRVEQDTLSSYPIEVQSESVDLTSLMGSLGAMNGAGIEVSSTDSSDTTDASAKSDQNGTPTQVTVDSVMGGIIGSLSGGASVNDLASFRSYLEDGDGRQIYDLSNDVSYGYDTQLYVYSSDTSDGVLQVNPSTLLSNVGLSSFSTEVSTDSSAGSLYANVSSSYSMGGQVDVWEQLMDNEGVIQSQYKVLAGREPQSADEVVLITDKDGHVSDYLLYALGIKDQSEVSQMFDDIAAGEQVDAGGSETYSFDDFLGMSFKLVLPSDLYQRGDDGVWHSIRSDQQAMKQVVDNAADLTVVGVICPNEDAAIGKNYGSIGYTSALTSQVVEETAASPLAQDQLDHPDIDVFTGLPFDHEGDGSGDEGAEGASTDEKVAASAASASDFADASGTEDGAVRAAAATGSADADDTVASSDSADETASSGVKSSLASAFANKAGSGTGSSSADGEVSGAGGLGGLLSAAAVSTGSGTIADASASGDMPELSSIDDLYAYLDTLPDQNASAMRTQLDRARAMGFSDDMLLGQARSMLSSGQTMGAGMYGMGSSSAASDQGTRVNDNGDLVSTATYEGNLRKIGVAYSDEPSSITIYPRSFEAKEKIVSLIEDYNRQMTESGQEDKVIQYSDYVGLIMSSVSNVINAISYILIAFVAISLVVSSIMIGIITYISVLERTKEIGVLRSIGASRGDVAMVFNAETFVIGLASGVLGILVTVLLDIPANIVIEQVSGVHNLAQLPPLAGLVLIAVSVVLTVGAGLIPARIASRKDPVVALRTE